MESQRIPSSQDSESTATITNPVEDLENITSPTRSSKSNGTKPRARPTVTPRTFTRFFTPRSSFSRGSRITASRQALRDVTAAASNRKLETRRASDQRSPAGLLQDENSMGVPTRKRRKISSSASLDVTVEGSSPLERVSTPMNDTLQSSDVEHGSESNGSDSEEELALSDKVLPSTLHPIKPIRRSAQRGSTGDLFFRELGLDTAKQTRVPVCSGLDWQYETANFYSAPSDSHLCDNLGDPTKNALPFCSSSCNTNSLVAVGDEEGGIRLLETARDGKGQFEKAYLPSVHIPMQSWISPFLLTTCYSRLPPATKRLKSLTCLLNGLYTP